MPGLYLAAILISAAGIAVLDGRFRLVFFRAPGRAAAVVAIGVVFFLLWDGLGIITNVFAKGGSALFVGVDVAPELPLEELFFLAFLSYLTLILWVAAFRVLTRRAQQRAGER
jgi:lycopene cyclase domain-containing protein